MDTSRAGEVAATAEAGADQKYILNGGTESIILSQLITNYLVPSSFELLRSVEYLCPLSENF